jgi:hypothetical protein
MPLTTCDVICIVNDDTGAAVAGAKIDAKLSSYEVHDGFVVPQLVSGATDQNGRVTLSLWPNELGAVESVYLVTITAPNGKRLKTTAVVPNVNSTFLHLITELPPYEGKSEGQLALSAALDATSNAASSAIEASSSALSASNASSIAIAKSNEITALVAPVGALTSSANASASTATTKASEASASASSANASASTATTKASEASASASSASTAQLAAEAARDQTLASFDSFDDRYLGPKVSDPIFDNDGNALIGGALYFNTSAMNSGGGMKVYDGVSRIWLAAYSSVSGALLSASNLADLASASTARGNLGLGNVENKSSATIRSELTSANITSALSYTPIKSSDLKSVATTGAYADLSGKPSKVSEFTNDAGYVPSANGTLINPTVTNYTETLFSVDTGTAISVSLSNGTIQQLTLTANATITMPAAVAGKSFVILLKQDAVGARSVTWSAVVWPSGVAPVITGTAGKRSICSFLSDGTNWYGVASGLDY